MTSDFKVGIEFGSVLTAISKQIYETPLAFIRENVQNAVDALRMQATRSSMAPDSGDYSVRVSATADLVQISDNGIGMTLEDLQNLFWTIGASGKRTAEARSAGCVGMFGIGGFANFGVCSRLTVTSQVADATTGWHTSLSREDIETAGGGIPRVTVTEATASPGRGTDVVGKLNESADVVQLEQYLREFVQFVPEHIFFNETLVSRQPFELTGLKDGSLHLIGTGEEEWSDGGVVVRGRLLESNDHVLYAELISLSRDGQDHRLRGWLRFEHGGLDTLKRGFKLCTTTLGTQIGVSGVVDCDLFSPTAGRDSLDPDSSSLLASIVRAMERVAVLTVLQSSARIAQHTRIFRYVRANRLVDEIGATVVELADGSESMLSSIEARVGSGPEVYFVTARDTRLAQLLQARGHIVVQLPSDSYKQRAVRDFLTGRCSAQALEGRVECVETYADLSRFEKVLLSEIEETILTSFEVRSTRLIPARLSEDIPVFAAENASEGLVIYVDVRHPELTKLEGLGVSSLLHSMVAAFCREYLGPALKSHSPKFFGSGAINLDFLAKRRTELWVLLTDDVQVLTQGTQRQIVRSTDIEVVRAGGGSPTQQTSSSSPPIKPKLVRIEGVDEFADLSGYYLRVPTAATVAYGDVIQQCDDRAAVWAGNKVLLVASDGISTAFQFEIRLDELIGVSGTEADQSSGSETLGRPVQSLFEGLYFPLPASLEPYLVPTPEKEVRIEVRCDWIDFPTARAWTSATDSSDQGDALSKT